MSTFGNSRWLWRKLSFASYKLLAASIFQQNFQSFAISFSCFKIWGRWDGFQRRRRKRNKKFKLAFSKMTSSAQTRERTKLALKFFCPGWIRRLATPLEANWLKSLLTNQRPTFCRCLRRDVTWQFPFQLSKELSFKTSFLKCSPTNFYDYIFLTFDPWLDSANCVLTKQKREYMCWYVSSL